MNPLALASATVLLASCASAQLGPEDHAAHHPPGAAAQAAPRASGRPGADAYQQQMGRMRDMHQRLQAAKTPEERQALMDEQMKLMQSGMAMMRGMHAMPGMAMGGPPAAGAGTGGMMGMHPAMEQRMALMEQMLQMMVDREAASPRR